MKLPTTIQSVSAFASAVVTGSAAALVFAGIASVSQSAPSLRGNAQPVAEVVRLEPVVVTMSKAKFDAIRAGEAADAAVARANDARRVNRG